MVEIVELLANTFSIGEGQAQMYSKSGDQYIAVQPEQTYGPNQYVGGGYRIGGPRPLGSNSGTTPTQTYSVRERGQVPVSSSCHVIKGVNSGTYGQYVGGGYRTDPQALTAELLLPKPTQSGKGTSASIFLLPCYQVSRG